MNQKKAKLMGRPRNIDRNLVLDAAEHIVLTRGAAEMTIDAVAKESGITKGGVQYCFGTKDGLVDAMVERWLDELRGQIDAIASAQPDATAKVCASIELTSRLEKLSDGRAAAMMAMLIQSPERLERVRKWYRDHLRGLDLRTPAGRSIRLAFIAMEGAFMLRSFGFMQMSAANWNELFAEIKALMPKSAANALCQTRPVPHKSAKRTPKKAAPASPARTKKTPRAQPAKTPSTARAKKRTQPAGRPRQTRSATA